MAGLFLLAYILLGRIRLHEHNVAMAGAVLAGLLLHAVVIQHPYRPQAFQFASIVLLIVFAGYYFLSTPWLVIFLFATSLAWFTREHNATPIHLLRIGFDLVIASSIAFLIHLVHVRWFRKVQLEQYKHRKERERLLETEQALHEKERSFALLLNNLPGVVYRVTPSWVPVYLSQGIVNLTGYSIDDLITQRINYLDILHPSDREAVLDAARTALQHRRAFAITYRIQTRSDDERWVFDKGLGVYDTEGRLVAVEGFVSEITAARQAQIAPEKSEERLRRVFDGSDIAIWDRDIQSNEITWSPNVHRILGLNPDHFATTTQSFLALVHPADRDDMVARVAAAVIRDQPYDTEYRIRRPDGTLGWLHARGKVYRNGDGVPVRMLGSFYDITLRKEADEKMRIAKERAEEAARVKTAIFANISREIRTPMTAILGFSELLLQRVHNDPQATTMANLILQAGKRLLNLLDSLLDLARIEAGKRTLQPTVTTLNGLVERVVTLMRVLADQKSLHLTREAAPPVYIKTDFHAAEQVLINVVTNAIRFTHQGGVSIRMRRAGNMGVLEIEDTGIGISQAFLPHVFEEFRQESEGLERAYEGCGLGLSISKKLLDRLGVTITICSEKGRGTCVTIGLPAVEAKQEAAAPIGSDTVAMSDIAPTQLRVLVVEDDAACARLIQSYLAGTHEVIWCECAEQALTRAATERFDLVLLDVHLKTSQIDRLQLLARLRALPTFVGTPVLACTAFAMKGDRERLLLAGFDGYLAKPFSLPQLLAALGQAVDRVG